MAEQVGDAVEAIRADVRHRLLAPEAELLDISYALHSAGLDDAASRAGTSSVIARSRHCQRRTRNKLAAIIEDPVRLTGIPRATWTTGTSFHRYSGLFRRDGCVLGKTG